MNTKDVVVGGQYLAEFPYTKAECWSGIVEVYRIWDSSPSCMVDVIVIKTTSGVNFPFRNGSKYGIDVAFLKAIEEPLAILKEML